MAGGLELGLGRELGRVAPREPAQRGLGRRGRREHLEQRRARVAQQLAEQRACVAASTTPRPSRVGTAHANSERHFGMDAADTKSRSRITAAHARARDSALAEHPRKGTGLHRPQFQVRRVFDTSQKHESSHSSHTSCSAVSTPKRVTMAPKVETVPTADCKKSVAVIGAARRA